MTERILFKLTKRDIIGKKVRHLRDSGIIPAVVYGNDHESIAVQANALELEKLVHKVGMTTPFNIELDDKTQLAIVKELDRDPIKGLLKHADFLTISAKELIETDIPIRLIGIGESEAERIGLVVMQVLDEIAVKSLPADMIPALEISIADLKIVGSKITIEDIKLPRGVEFADKEIDPNLTIVNVYDPAELEAANEAAGGDATEETEVVADNGTPTEAEAEPVGDAKTKTDSKNSAEAKK